MYFGINTNALKRFFDECTINTFCGSIDGHTYNTHTYIFMLMIPLRTLNNMFCYVYQRFACF